MTFKDTAAGVVAGGLFGIKTTIIGLGIAAVGVLFFPILVFKVLLNILQRSATRENPNPPGIGIQKMAVIVPLSLIVGLLAAPASFLFSLFYEMPRQAAIGFRMSRSEGFTEAMWFLVDDHRSFSILLRQWLESDVPTSKSHAAKAPVERQDDIFPIPLEETRSAPVAPVPTNWSLSGLRPNSGRPPHPRAEEPSNLPQSPSPI